MMAAKKKAAAKTKKAGAKKAGAKEGCVSRFRIRPRAVASLVSESHAMTAKPKALPRAKRS